MSKHVGDLYYDGNSHAYRFRNDGKGYYWERLKDTDVTKALQDSEDALAAAKSAQEAAALAKNMTLQLSNEYQGISVDSDGNYGTFPGNVSTQAVVMYGTQDITSDCNFTIIKSDSVTGSWNNATKTYTVTALSADDGWVDIKATYISVLSVVKRFSLAKIYAGKKGKDGVDGLQGPKGEQGVPGRTYFLESPSYVIKQRANGSVAPSYITLSAWYRDGNAETRTAYKGRFKIEESVDGENWKTVYSSAKDETSVSHNLYTVLSTKAGGIITTASGRSIGIPRDVSAIKCTLYAAGGFSQPLDSQSMAVVIDVDALTHEEIFNLLTNDGAIKGIYKEGNQLYISFTYAKGGTLKLGGPNNGYGTFEVYDASGNVICKINNTDGFKNIKGNEWAQIKESIFSAGYGSITDGLLDLSAQYENKRNVVLQSVTGDLIFKVAQNLMIEGMKALTAGNPMVFSPTYLYVGYSSSSSMHYKVLGKSIKEDELEDLYRIKVIWAKYKDGYLSEQDERYGKEMPMFIAEDIDRRFPLAVDHNEKGKAENWNYRIMIPCMFAMLKNDHEKVLALQSDNQILLSKIDALSAEVEQLKELINNISRKD